MRSRASRRSATPSSASRWRCSSSRSQAPTSYAELMDRMIGAVPFACCFALLVWIWSEHNAFFRRFGLQDGYTIVLNSVLLFVVLLYVYPLKFMFDSPSRGCCRACPAAKAMQLYQLANAADGVRGGLHRDLRAVRAALPARVREARGAGLTELEVVRREGAHRAPSAERGGRRAVAAHRRRWLRSSSRRYRRWRSPSWDRCTGSTACARAGSARSWNSSSARRRSRLTTVHLTARALTSRPCTSCATRKSSGSGRSCATSSRRAG